MSQAASVADSGQADELRQEMADGLVEEGWITSRHAEEAFRIVPRHLFTPPGTPLEISYNGHAAPVMKTVDGATLPAAISWPAGLTVPPETRGDTGHDRYGEA